MNFFRKFFTRPSVKDNYFNKTVNFSKKSSIFFGCSINLDYINAIKKNTAYSIYKIPCP